MDEGLSKASVAMGLSCVTLRVLAHSTVPPETWLKSFKYMAMSNGGYMSVLSSQLYTSGHLTGQVSLAHGLCGGYYDLTADMRPSMTLSVIYGFATLSKRLWGGLCRNRHQ